MTPTARADRQRALLRELAEVEADGARLYARRMEVLADIDETWNGDVAGVQEQFGVIEVAGTGRIGQTRASTQLVNAHRLRHLMPGTLAALHAGAMHTQTAILLLELTTNCSEQVVKELEHRLLPTIIDANTTDVRRLVLRTIPEIEADLDPVLTEERLAEARSRRSVRQSDRGDGMVQTSAELDAVSARRWALDFEELVRAQKVADDRAGVVRTSDQRRADVFAQLPSRFLALLHAVQKGKTEQLLALAQVDPDLVDDLGRLATYLPPEAIAGNEALEPESPPDAAEAAVSWDLLSDEPAAPLPTEPPPDGWLDPDPPPTTPHWTELSPLELASTVLGLPVKNPLVVNVHVPMTTLLELDQRTGTIDGGGALPASQVRLLVPDAALRRVFVDAASGVPLGVDPAVIPAPSPATGAPDYAKAGMAASTPQSELRARLLQLMEPYVLREASEPRHDPSRQLQQLVDLRDQRCIGIGCSLPARRCHHDHEVPYPAGPTAAWNLSAKSARCHRAKHAGWTATRHGPGPQHGQTTWTSPLGHSYTSLSPWLHLARSPAAQPVAVP